MVGKIRCLIWSEIGHFIPQRVGCWLQQEVISPYQLARIIDLGSNLESWENTQIRMRFSAKKLKALRFPAGILQWSWGNAKPRQVARALRFPFSSDNLK
jgi:hypothetical protein